MVLGDIDFGLLVFEPHVVSFYEGLGWQVFPGELIVKQHGETTKFTLCGSMTLSLRLRSASCGRRSTSMIGVRFGSMGARLC
jgi:hypothetical protein